MGHNIAARRAATARLTGELKLGLTPLRFGACMILASAALPIPASAQQTSPANSVPNAPSEMGVLPEEYLTGPLPPGGTETVMEETFIAEDGVETVIRTRRIEPRRTPPPVQAAYLGAPVQYGPNGERLAPGAAPGYAVPPSVAPSGQQPTTSYGAPNQVAGVQNVMTHEQWIAECERRTQVQEDARYNCQSILDSHISQYGGPNTRGPATRSIPQRAPGLVYPSANVPQNPVVPVEYEQQQRVVVRESVREVSVPASAPANSVPN